MPALIPGEVEQDPWVGPAPWRPFHATLIRGGFRAYRNCSGGGMTDGRCLGFDGAPFCLGLHETGPVGIIPPDGKDHERLTYRFADGVTIYHGRGLSCAAATASLAMIAFSLI